jgi:hypothetical protein
MPKSERVRRSSRARAKPVAAPKVRGHRRLAVIYDTDGPRVRLGVLWFLVNVATWFAGVWAITVLYGVIAGVAALQTARCWRRQGARPDRAVAGAGAVAMVLAAGITTGALGIAILGLVVAAFVVAERRAAATPRRRTPAFVDAAATIKCSLFPGLAAASVVVTARFSLGGAIALILLVSAYETGDYIVGSGAPNPYEGPVAGATAIVVITFAVTALGVRPLSFPGSFALGAMAAVLCPIGQLVASAVLPSVTAPASALRRLDSLLVLAPAWALVTGWLV